MEWPLAWRRRKALERMLEEERRASRARATGIVESLERDGAGAGRELLSLYIRERRRMAKGRGRRVLARIGASVLLLAAGAVAWMFWLAAVDA
ncbi:hypothetical protein ATSB10_01820 [Dyella thiooxydans]|uniref:Uncharacterized protein n=1 Tax=Dyella thiooxydans TaxID=445710 RepID=A0A160MWZ1_9GAMM|nr:hypothetical protein [Dyella thiooxydans]AND67636.1 hypothetical protein ATSB10_01820 [Dyella thiooxydans]